MRWKQITIRVLRWVATAWLLLIAVLGVLETADPYVSRSVPWHEWLSPVLLFAGAGIGFMLSWKRERAAGLLVIGCYVAALIVACFSRSACLPASVTAGIGLFYATPGALLLIGWYLSQPSSGDATTPPNLEAPR